MFKRVLLLVFIGFLFSCVANKETSLASESDSEHDHDYCSLAEEWIDCKKDDSSDSCFVGGFWNEFEDELIESNLKEKDIIEHISFQRKLLDVSHNISSDILTDCIAIHDDPVTYYYEDGSNSLQRKLKKCIKDVVDEYAEDLEEDFCS